MKQDARFVTKIVGVGIQSDNRREILNPNWGDVQEVLRSFAAGTHVRVELDNCDGSIAMTIYGERGVYFVVIFFKESTYHYFWNGRPCSGELRAIGGNLFDSEKVCEDFETVASIAKHFWKTGACLESVQWISEEIPS